MQSIVSVRRILGLAVALVLVLSMQAFIGAGRAEAAPGPSFTNPVVDVPNSADPTLVYHAGFYYYVATTWSSQVVMRKSPTIAGLRAAPEQVVVSTGGSTMWAPHLEMIDGRWYLYYSVEQGSAARRTHVAQSAGSDPMGPYTVRGILDLMPNQGWAIDAAPLRLNGNLYMTFSAFAGDGLQSLYIAPMTNPWTAGAHGTRISAPTLSWETQNGAVNEGSFALQRNGRTFLTYSASHCNGPNYKIGMLEYTGANPLQMSSWTKAANPLFQRSDANGVYGPGHHSFFTSPDGTETWIAYHANDSASDGCGTTRTTRVQRISWNANGTPNLGVPVATTTVLAGPSGEPNLAPVAIRNRHSGLCLDDYEFGTQPGAEVRQWTCNSETVQDWYLTDLGNGYFAISNLYSGLCLDDYEFGTQPGAEVRQWTCNNQNVQQWRITDAGGGYSTIVNRHSGLCLDNYNFGTQPGAEIRQWTCLNNAAQQWTLA
ncbi:family 43 glycosylhydrolase [Glycomyces harbinensis]|uniref:Beta-xylosidase, GH43 family n=1 Tax=Glycomyces harbinensis TaxID=58114 RepID=A0A1G6TST9_9ACTN|nr:family 43 glycosylhydrolase [Glycomyces harbinensis]SDD31457.1 Beta-xylosidase, GH43 family [Glycomyces harbinensis]